MGLRTLDENWVLGEALMPLTVASSPVEPGTDTRPNIMVLLARLQIGHLETQHKAFDNLVKVMQEGDIVKTVMDAADIVENNNESMEGETEAPDDEMSLRGLSMISLGVATQPTALLHHLRIQIFLHAP